MGIFFEKPTKGPDNFGGIWPIRDKGRCVNRSGSTISLGEVVQLALTQGSATEIATNDANSYIPGASNDTVWNTVIDPRSNTSTVAGAAGSTIHTGGIFGVCLDTEVADNSSGWFQFFGICDAYVIRSNSTATIPGSALTVRASGTGSPCFDPVILTNEIIVATMMGFSNALMTTRRLRKVLLHQGMFWQTQFDGAYTA
jgi:hypothetical protein